MINTIFYFPESLTFEEYRNLFDSGQISKNTIVFAKAQKSIYMGGDNYSYQEVTPSSDIPAAANNGTFCVKTKVDNNIVVAADFTADQNSDDDITFIQGDNITLITDTNNRTITIAASTEQVLPFDRISVHMSSISDTTDKEPIAIVYNSLLKTFIAEVEESGGQFGMLRYYYSWPGYEEYVDTSNQNKPYYSKKYSCNGKIYTWNGEDLTTSANQVSTDPQDLTVEQKTQAQINIGLQRGVSNGVASLDINSKIPSNQLDTAQNSDIEQLWS